MLTNILIVIFCFLFVALIAIFILNRQLKQQKEKYFAEILELEKNKTALLSENDFLKRSTQSEQAKFSQKIKEMEMSFENLANRIFDDKAKVHRAEAEKNIQFLISPLKEKMGEFQKRVEDTYNQEMRERASLKAEIQQIILTTKEMGFETKNLTKALRGDVKTQGTWGEFVLERLLQSVGLRAGEEYILQGKDLKLKSDEGFTQRPDVILNLPDDKHLIIDSKVTLVSYERAVNCENTQEKEKNLQDFIRSLKEHIKGLANKNYQNLENLKTPEFVLLFFPIEGAFAEALRVDPHLFQDAWDKNIIIVGPTTLLATLKTVASLWKQEKQSKNSLLMAKECGLLYDKFCGFLSDLEKMGDHLKKAQSAYSESMEKMRTGRGNLIDKVEKIKILGAKTSKQIPEKFKQDDDNMVAQISQFEKEL